MRGTTWVNAFQTVMLLTFGTLAFVLIAKNIGGFDHIVERLAANPKTERTERRKNFIGSALNGA